MIKDGEFKAMKSCFFENWKKYESFRKRMVEELPHVYDDKKLLF